MQKSQIAEAGKVGDAEACVVIAEGLRIGDPFAFGVSACVWACEADEAAGAFDVFDIVTIGGGFTCALHSDSQTAK